MPTSDFATGTGVSSDSNEWPNNNNDEALNVH